MQLKETIFFDVATILLDSTRSSLEVTREQCFSRGHPPNRHWQQLQTAQHSPVGQC